MRHVGDVKAMIASTAVIIQATPVGRHGERHDIPWDKMPKGCAAFEMLYAAERTPFLRDADAHGGVCIEGWEMLLAQGMRAFERWTQTKAPEAAMRSALLNHLRGQSRSA